MHTTDIRKGLKIQIDGVPYHITEHQFVKPGKGEERIQEFPSSVGGLAFAPKGFRLAITHYNGAPTVIAHDGGRRGAATPRHT